MVDKFFLTFKTKGHGFKSRNRLLPDSGLFLMTLRVKIKKLNILKRSADEIDFFYYSESTKNAWITFFAGFFNLLIESKFGVTQLHPKGRNCHWIWAASPGPVWVNFFRNEWTWPKLKPILMDPLELFQIWICLTNSHYCWD